MRLAALAFLVSVSTSNAASIQAEGPFDGLHIISVSGQINFGDEAKFLQIAANVPRAVVIFGSPGGNLTASIEIGKMIRLRGYGTYVGPRVVCASGCAIAWLGGATRAAHPNAMIGFHAASMDGSVTSVGNAEIGAYFGLLGLSRAAIRLFTEAAPSDMFWLTPPMANALGLEVRYVDLAANQNQASPNAQQSPAIANPAPSLPPTSPRGPPPATPAMTTAELVKDTEIFIQFHTRMTQLPPDRLATYISQHYGDQVVRDNRTRTRAEVSEEDIAFIQRWTSRTYTAVPGTSQISCDQNTRVCTASYDLEWSMSNDARRIRASGRSRVDLTIYHDPRRPIIQRETSRRIRSETTRY